jgi:hypothetical protein
MNYEIEITTRIRQSKDADLARLHKLYPNSADVTMRVRRELLKRKEGKKL